MYIRQGGSYSEPRVTATDDIDGDIIDNIVIDGDIAGDYRGDSFGIGNYILTVTPYAENCLAGNQGASMTITFEISPGVSSDHSSRLKPYFSYDLSFLFIKLRSKYYSITVSFPCIEK